jgi:serine protease Do
MKKTVFVLLLGAALGACHTPGAITSADTVPPHFMARIQIERAAVVDITANVLRQRPQEQPAAQWLDQFFPRARPLPDVPELAPLQNLGTGVIISSDGFILTNAHVVAGASEVAVRLQDRTHPYTARVIGADAYTDIALLKIDAVDLPVVSLGRSKQLKPGEWVATVGSPDGFPNTISAGVMRGRARHQGGYPIPLIQADVVPQSSGALMNANGEVVGISAGVIAPPQRDSAFAVPIEVALDVARELHMYGKAAPARLGKHAEELLLPDVGRRL